LTPIRIGMPRAFAASPMTLTFSCLRMLPGLMRTAAQPASIAAMAYFHWKWISATTGTRVVTDERLAEFNFGELEGIGYDDLHHHYPDLYLSMINHDSSDHSFPNGESRRAFQSRVV
jgi:broad specificity phosphatase PhoE